MAFQSLTASSPAPVRSKGKVVLLIATGLFGLVFQAVVAVAFNDTMANGKMIRLRPSGRGHATVASCGSEPSLGSTQAVAVVEVRNKGSEPAAYRVVVAFETTDGRTPFGRAIVVAGPVAPAQTARQPSAFGPEVPEGVQLRCRIADTLRFTGS